MSRTQSRILVAVESMSHTLLDNLGTVQAASSYEKPT